MLIFDIQIHVHSMQVMIKNAIVKAMGRIELQLGVSFGDFIMQNDALTRI